MAKLNLTDLLSFAKAGYSPRDVKELLEMEVPENVPAPKNPEPAQASEEEKAKENAPKESANAEPSQNAAETDDVDYKKLYEEEAEKVKQLQIANTRQDASQGDSNEDPMKGLDDILVSLM